MQKYTVILLVLTLTLTACGQKRVTLYSKADKIKPLVNIPLSANKGLEESANFFADNFNKLTGESLKIERSDGFNEKEIYVALRINPTLKNEYCISKSDANITIQALDNKTMNFAITDFFNKYTAYSELNLPTSTSSFIDVPERFKFCSSPDFEYREPYFSSNFDADFRKWNRTNYLELEWGIWGHNLPKKLKPYKLDQSVYAEVNNKRNIEQFCFTSDTLFKYLDIEVKKIYDSDNALNKYMILPNDNNLVCTCETCTSVGNTKDNAAPAVFSLLNKLSEKYRNLDFFTTAYVTVKRPPNFKVNNNVGVFYSTINMQNGIPIENSVYAKKFNAEISNWKEKVSKIYIWDYAVNFDNYLDIYPILLTLQQNLKLYKNLGVSGVFVHGSEYNYGTFQELKTNIISKLLWDVNTNVSKEISNYFSANFPPRLTAILTGYYLSIEDAFINSEKELNIYSGIDESVDKYLNPKNFYPFYEKFIDFKKTNEISKEYQKIATGLTFLKLEIMRTQGIGEYGYARLNKKQEIIIDKNVPKLLNDLEELTKASGIETFNEVNYQILDYVASWREKVKLDSNRKHFFLNKPFKVITKKDEDYTDVSVLNDGAFGLKDYNTNWHIVSIDDLALQIDKKEIEESENVTMSFLQDTKHGIYYPSRIEILTENFKLLKEVTIPKSPETRNVKELSISLPMASDTTQLSDTFILKITRSKNSGKNLLACDEVIFN